MVICFTLDKKIQLFTAQVLSAVYGLIMVMVCVGIALQIKYVLSKNSNFVNSEITAKVVENLYKAQLRYLI